MSKKHKTNAAIRAKEVMVIDIDGTKLGTLPIADAIAIAKSKTLDLVEVSPNTEPPVCKILDFGKHQYQKSKKNNEGKKKQKVIKLKEIKMGPTIGDHDYQFKVAHMKKFIAGGDKVKVTIVFRGRMISHKELGHTLLSRVTEDTCEFADIEVAPKNEGNNLMLLLIGKGAKQV